MMPYIPRCPPCSPRPDGPEPTEREEPRCELCGRRYEYMGTLRGVPLYGYTILGCEETDDATTKPEAG